MEITNKSICQNSSLMTAQYTLLAWDRVPSGFPYRTYRCSTWQLRPGKTHFNFYVRNRFMCHV